MQTSRVFAFLVGALFFAFSALTNAEELFKFDSDNDSDSVEWQLNPEKKTEEPEQVVEETEEPVTNSEEILEVPEDVSDNNPDRIIPDRTFEEGIEEPPTVASRDDQNWYEDELRNLRESRDRRLQKRLRSMQQNQAEYEQELFKENMNDPNVHFRVALTHQSRGDAEGAIIHMQKAEALYKNQKNLRGMARSRKALRKYYKAYGYRPEDFDLTR